MTRQIFLLLVACSVASIQAQQSAAPQTDAAADTQRFTMKTSVNRVLVDVTVTDARGNPVHGLSQDDFSVEEDGEPQRVTSFDAYNFDKGMDYTPPKLPALGPHTFVNLPSDPERGPLYVLFYDLVNIPQEDQIYARAQLVKFVENKPVGARIAILVSSDGVHMVQGFTSDKSKLLAAVDPNGTGPHVPKVFLMGVNFGQGDKLATSVRLNSIAQYLAPMEGRKVLIWFASKFPLSLFPSPDETEQFQKEAKKTLNLFADDQIALYPVDVSGVVLAEEYGAPDSSGEMPGGGGLSPDSRDNGIQRATGSAPSTADKAPPKGPGYKDPGYSMTFSSYLNQDGIAKVTGGKAIYSANNLKGSLETVTEEAGNYYTLGYSPSNKNFDGHLRHIEVKLKQGKNHLAFRHAYYGAKADTQAEPADGRLSASMKHGAPEFHQLVFEAHVEATGSPERGTSDQMKNLKKAQAGTESAKTMKPIRLQVYTVEYAVMRKQSRADGDFGPQFELAAAAYDADGKLLNSVTNTTAKADSAADKPTATKDLYRAEQRLDAPLDTKFIRIAVRDTRTGKVGAMEIPLPLTPAK